MKILFAGGGTAGHINPALSIASFIKERDPEAQILYVGAKSGMEERLVPESGFEFKSIEISGFQRKLSLEAIKKNFVTLKRIITSSIESKKIIKEWKPDICVGTGGYVSGPVLKKASQMGIPIILHEQNAYPGITTKMLAKRANCIMLAVAAAKEHLPKCCKIIVTGNPVRKEITNATKEASRATLKLDSRPVILSFGGSLGSRKINEAVADLIINTQKSRYQHIHAYGQYGKWFPDFLKQKGINIKQYPNLDIREYIKNMPVCLAAADLIICRAGAITISELQAQGKPAILIPSPNVAENHQYHNAMTLVKAKAAEIIEEKNLTGDTLKNKVEEMLSNEKILKEFSENSRKTAVLDANERIYSIICNEMQR